MSRLLYVDEDRPVPDGWTGARTVTEAIRLLATEDWDVVSLDYDIKYELRFSAEDKEALVLDSPETFEPVCRYLALMSEDDRPEVQIHSANPKAEPLYRKILKEDA